MKKLKMARGVSFTFEEGEMAKVSDADTIATYVPMKWSDGQSRTLYFQPLFAATSNLTLNDLPIMFDSMS